MARTALLALRYQNEVLHPEGRIKVGMAETSDIRERVKERAAAHAGADLNSAHSPPQPW